MQIYHHDSHTSAAVPFLPPSLFPAGLLPGPSSTSLENSSDAFPSPLSGAGNAQDAPDIVELPTCSLRGYRSDGDLYVSSIP
jgi:hypothetical protein